MAKLASHISKSTRKTFRPNCQQDVPEVLAYILNDLAEVTTVPSNLFSSSVQTCTTCNTCLNQSLTEEYQNIIRLQLSESIATSLSIFLKEESLAEQNSWNCSACNALRESSRRVYFARAPTILFIQLMRFTNNDENVMVKCKDLIACDIKSSQFGKRMARESPPG